MGGPSQRRETQYRPDHMDGRLARMCSARRLQLPLPLRLHRLDRHRLRGEGATSFNHGTAIRSIAIRRRNLCECLLRHCRLRLLCESTAADDTGDGKPQRERTGKGAVQPELLCVPPLRPLISARHVHDVHHHHVRVSGSLRRSTEHDRPEGHLLPASIHRAERQEVSDTSRTAALLAAGILQPERRVEGRPILPGTRSPSVDDRLRGSNVDAPLHCPCGAGQMQASDPPRGPHRVGSGVYQLEPMGRPIVLPRRGSSPIQRSPATLWWRCKTGRSNSTRRASRLPDRRCCYRIRRHQIRRHHSTRPAHRPLHSRPLPDVLPDQRVEETRAGVRVDQQADPGLLQPQGEIPQIRRRPAVRDDAADEPEPHRVVDAVPLAPPVHVPLRPLSGPAHVCPVSRARHRPAHRRLWDPASRLGRHRQGRRSRLADGRRRRLGGRSGPVPRLR